MQDQLDNNFKPTLPIPHPPIWLLERLNIVEIRLDLHSTSIFLSGTADMQLPIGI